MTTKKVVLIAVGVLGGLALVVALVAGAILGYVFYSLDHSEAAQTAKSFLRNSDKLKQDVGAVRDFGWFTTGSVNAQGALGNAELHLKTNGERASVNATVVLSSRSGREWRVVDAYYDDSAGRRVYLTKNFDDADSQGTQTSSGEGDEGETDEAKSGEGGAQAGSREAVIGDSEDEPRRFDEESFKTDVLEAKLPVLVVFGSLANEDSRELDDVIESLSSKYEERINLVDYSLDEQPALLQRFNVKRVPTIVIFKDGQEQERRAGKLSAEELSHLLDKYLDR
ncbi:MAG: thioredoxin family protein [Pyrinomonadaceae bacterium]